MGEVRGKRLPVRKCPPGMAASEVARRLLDDYRIFTVLRGIELDECVRVAPHLYPSVEDLAAPGCRDPRPRGR